MKERFEGRGRHNLADAIKRQEFVSGDEGLTEALIAKGTLLEFQRGEYLTVEDGEDNDLFLLLTGSVGVVVKGNQVAMRRAGQLVGEMAAIDPTLKRSASVVALDTVVTLKLGSADFSAVGDSYPQIWLPIARELSRRLSQRNDLIPAPNEAPKLFIISSAEALHVAREIQAALERDVFCRVWNEGVFFAGGYALDDLEKAVLESDFAIAVCEPDDITESRGGRSPTIRDNVLFELGLFMGTLSRARSFLVHPRINGLKLPSDLHGLTLLSYEPGKPDELASRLGPACNAIRKQVKSLGVRKIVN